MNAMLSTQYPTHQSKANHTISIGIPNVERWGRRKMVGLSLTGMQRQDAWHLQCNTHVIRNIH